MSRDEIIAMAREADPKAAVRHFKINNLGLFCLTALCF